MVYIFLILLLLNTSFFYSVLFNKKIEQTLFFSIFSYILILFVFGIFSVLNVGFIIILTLNTFLLGYNIYSLIKNKQIIKNNFLTLGLLFLIISYIIIVWQSLGRLATQWDEFSHWALVVKNMYELGNLGIGSDSTVMIKDYLSGTSLFQYFCVKLCGEYKESMLYVGMDLLILSFILPILSNVGKNKKFISSILYFILLLIPTLFYPTLFSSLYVDAALGLTFAYGLYTYFINRKSKLTTFDIVNLMSSYAMLIFIKDFGIVLLLISFVTVLIDNIFIRNMFKLKNLIKQNYLIFITPVPALFIKIIWGVVLNLNGVISDGSTANIFKTLKNLLSFDLLDYQSATTTAFAKATISNTLTETIIPITYVIALIITLIIGYFAIIKLSEKEKKSITLLITFVILGGVAYAGLLYLAYISVFSAYEAVRLASFNRYMSTYALAAIYISIAVYIGFVNDKNNLGKFSMILFGLFAINFNFAILLNMTFSARYKVNETNLYRNQYKKMVKKTKRHVQKKDYTYFVSTNDNGIDYYIARYEITPNKLNKNFAWSIGTPYSDEDIWTVYKTKDEWRTELLKEYKYVYLYDIDDQFIEQYKSLFIDENIDDNQLYKVIKTNSYAMLKFVE